jgi:NADH:ubiquinone oxidoreductase subunit 3 (subunit A)
MDNWIACMCRCISLSVFVFSVAVFPFFFCIGASEISKLSKPICTTKVSEMFLFLLDLLLNFIYLLKRKVEKDYKAQSEM